MDIKTYFFSGIIKLMFEQLAADIEKNIVNVFDLSAYQELIYNEEVANPTHISATSKHIVGLCLIEVFFSLKNNINTLKYIQVEQLPSFIIHVITDGLKRAHVKYGDIIYAFASEKFNQYISRFDLISRNPNSMEAQEFRKVLTTAFNALFDNNLNIHERFRVAISALFMGYLRIMKLDQLNINNIQDYLDAILKILENSYKFIDRIISNIYDPYINELKRQTELLEAYNASLSKLNIESFRKQTQEYKIAAERINSAHNDEELNNTLRDIIRNMSIHTSWENHDSFDAFMSDKSARMEFK